MKKLISILILIIVLVGCSSRNDVGKCVGFGEKSPNYVYEISTRNAIIAFLFFETGVVPIVWALDYAYCPIREKVKKVNQRSN